MRIIASLIATITILSCSSASAEGVDKLSGKLWFRHTIDAGSRGADGIRVADINGDGLPDLTTGWEEGGQVRVYLHPGAAKVNQPWPAVVVGQVASPEDAVFVDLDEDGRLDVVSSCEGRTKSVFVHWSPNSNRSWLDHGAWRTSPFSATQQQQQWMFGLPMQVDGDNGMDLVLGSKGTGASVGWLQSPAQPRNLKMWTWHRICDAGWVMSLCHRDVDGDGDQDLLVSDRVGLQSGCWWLENPDSPDRISHAWKKHPIAGQHHEVMFMDLADLDGDGLEDLVCAVRQDNILWARRLSIETPIWQQDVIPMPRGVGSGKAVAVGDIDGDKRADVVVSCEHAEKVSGVFWLQQERAGNWTAHDISGTHEGVKFDRIELIDLDADGDLDVVTCEERDNLGVIWYENPSCRAR